MGIKKFFSCYREGPEHPLGIAYPKTGNASHARHHFSLLILILATCAFISSIFVVASAQADDVNYFYDSTGRLARAAKGTEGLIYNYDEVGNLLAINKETIAANPPIIQNISPDVFFIGSTVPVVISGQNLFTTEEVILDNPSLVLQILSVSDSEIRAKIAIPADASPATANLTVTTFYGADSGQVLLSASQLSFSPGQVALAPGDSGVIDVSVSPSIGRDLTIILNNELPSVVRVSPFVTIPISGVTSFTVDALQEGISSISCGDTQTTVFVLPPFVSEPGEELTSKTGPVSVYVERPSSGDTTISSLPISAYIETALSGDATTSSLPVSVYVERPSSGNTTISSPPISAYINESPLGDATVIAPLVSAQISP